MARKAKTVRKPRAATAVDQSIGRQLTKRRVMLDMSKVELAKLLGITHRQVQKYELGINRISVSRLVQIAAALDAPVGWFFRDLDKQPSPGGREEGEALLDLLSQLPKRGPKGRLAALWELLTHTTTESRRLPKGRPRRRATGRQR